ncbi:hypothetical protein ABIE48_000094 [Paenibacillus sp. OAE614]
MNWLFKWLYKYRGVHIFFKPDMSLQTINFIML